MTSQVVLQQPMEMALALAIEHQAEVHFNDSDFSLFPGSA